MKTALKLMTAALGLAFGVAHAGFITVGGTPAGANGQVNSLGACNIDFNAGNAINSCGATYSNVSASNFPTGTLNGVHATPAGDTTAYLTIGPTEGNNVVVTLGLQANYYGFFTGSLDSFNLVQFFLGNVLVDSFTGNDINLVAFGGSATGDITKSAYINYFPTIGNQQTFFDRVMFSSSQNAFETDNHAFAVRRFQTPEPESVALLGMGVLALFASRRRKAIA